ncbi:mitotic checkpoint serine/threonine-protein kinase BUB1 beta [Pristis pectinata]|uniref:mitotic checkpoint serine/threonine-protein kinase BUB1 beta n=1 Tax=Pristis pectinata TaxID=685728 RepID=UPI00223E0275|nr:mitotic checkpoint serine/threonine-protein kinase BUB1 beta [Pristis pectinata]
MAEADWELSKENVQPLKQGRDVGTLKDVLAQHEGPSQISIQEQKLAFEAEIRFYSGNDPLDVWDRYIKWTEQVFPHGGTDSNLSALLERSLELFLRNDQYYSDLRYLGHWLKFVDYCTDPLEVFDFLKSKGIGISHAAFYIAWAERYELLGNSRKAEAVLQEGIQLKAEPLEKLQHHHRYFQSRIFKQVVASINEGTNEELVPEPVQPQRTTLGDLKRSGQKKALAPVNRIGNSVRSQSRGLGQHVVSTREQCGTFEVFNENQLCSQPTDQLRLTQGQWSTLPSTSAKENEIKPGHWNTSGMSQRSNMHSVPFSAASSTSKPDFKLYEEESAHVETTTPRKIEPLFTPVLSARKPSKEANPLARVQLQNCKEEKMVVSMYSKDKVYAGLREFSFEELRAEEFKKKYKAICKEQEQKLLKLKKEKEEMEQLIHMTEMRIKEHIQPEAQQNKSDLQTQMPRNASILAAQPQTSCTDKNVSLDISCSASLHPNFQNQAAGNIVTNSGAATWEFGAQSNISEMKAEDSYKDELNRDEMRLKNPNLSNYTDGDCMESGQPNVLVEVHNLSANRSLQHVQPSPTVCTREALDVINDMFHAPVTCSQVSENQFENLGAVPTICNNDYLAYEAQFMKNADKSTPVPNQMPSTFFGLPPATVSFSIFDENADVEDQENKPPADYLKARPRWPLSGILVPSKHILTEGTCVAECDDLDGIEPINEDHFESNDYPNKTFGPFPENTCDFTRGAHLVSTPFHRNSLNDDQNKPIKWIPGGSTKNALSSLSPLKESMYDQPLHMKKLSPIQEASEDGLSSAATTSSAGSSTSVGGLCAMSDLNVFEKSEPGQLNSSEVFNVNSISGNPWDIETQNQLLLSLPIPLSSLQEFYVQNDPVPTFEVGRELNLGSQTFNIKQVAEHEQCRMFYGMDPSVTLSKAIIKVYSHRVPWDFYINQQLKMRLGSQFNKYFSQNQCCYLFDNGCVTVDQDKNSETLKDLSHIWESVPEALVVFLTLDLLALVELMHTAEIVHGGIAPETLFLSPGLYNSASPCPDGNSLVKLMDFTHSLDLRLQADVATFTGFPTVRSLPNRDFLLECTSAYQVDLLGIADTMHFLLFGGHLDVCKEGSLWILSPTSYRMELLYMELWNSFFEKILNAGDAPSITTLSELQQTVREAIEPDYEILWNDAFVQNLTPALSE